MFLSFGKVVDLFLGNKVITGEYLGVCGKIMAQPQERGIPIHHDNELDGVFRLICNLRMII